MGKALESIGVIDGYEVTQIGKMKAKNDKIFEEIIKYDQDIKEKIREIVNKSSGEVFAITKKGIINGIYLFEAETKNEVNILRQIKTVYTDEVPMDVREKCDNYIINILKDSVAIQEYDKVILKDKVIQPNPKKSKKEQALTALIGLVLGFAIGWLMWDNVLEGLVNGIVYAIIFSSLKSIKVTTKRGRKKKDDN